MNNSMSISVMASKLRRLVRVACKVDEEMDAYGAAECSGLAWMEIRAKAANIAREAGFNTVTEALDAIEERTSARWVYFSGLGALY